MLASLANTPTIDVIDREIDGKFRSLVFAPALELRYEEDTKRRRQRYFILTGQIATVLYDLFLFSDWQMTPDVFPLSLIMRLGVFTPLFLLVWFIIDRSPSKRVREGTSSALAIISAGLVMWVLTRSHSPDLPMYQYGTLLIMLFTAVVQRLRFRYAAVTILSIFVIQMVAIPNLHGFTSKLLGTGLTFFGTVSVLLLWATYAIEWEQRRSYLLDLRSCILNHHLDQRAKHDALTGLWNRLHLDTVTTSVWADARMTPRNVAVILLDIDHFKIFNDSNGHLEGDKCLKRIGACIRDAVADEDSAVAFRFGGEEFLVLIEGADLAAARQGAERIRDAIHEVAIPHPALGPGAIVTASFGIASGPAPDLLHRAAHRRRRRCALRVETFGPRPHLAGRRSRQRDWRPRYRLPSRRIARPDRRTPNPFDIPRA